MKRNTLSRNMMIYIGPNQVNDFTERTKLLVSNVTHNNGTTKRVTSQEPKTHLAQVCIKYLLLISK